MTLQTAIAAYERHFTDPVDHTPEELLAFIDWALDFYAQGRCRGYRPAMDTEDEVWP